MLGDRARLVALERPDKVPFQAKIGQGDHLVDPFLDVVFAKSVKPRSVGGGHGVGAKGLADRQETHGFGRPARFCACRCH